mgnify:CR=1 FL=1
MSKKIIIFDLDGVLINSINNMKFSWGKVQSKHKVKKRFSDYSRYIGLPFRTILKKLKIKKDLKEIESTYNEASIKNINKIHLYNGATRTLNILKKKYKIAIVTSKNRKRTNMILKKKKLNINLVISPNKKLNGKPSADSILEVLKMSNIKKKKEAIYIGDMKTDFLTAKNAGITYIQSNYGYSKFKHKYSINSINQLPMLLNHINF